MDTQSQSSKKARLEARITAEQKALIERAAAYEGRTVSEFVVYNLRLAAQAVIQEHEMLRLDAAQSRALVEALISPPKPNNALKKAAKTYRQRVISR